MTELRPSIRVEGLFRVPIYESELREQLRKYYSRGNAVRDIGDRGSHLHRELHAIGAFRTYVEQLG